MADCCHENTHFTCGMPQFEVCDDCGAVRERIDADNWSSWT